MNIVISKVLHFLKKIIIIKCLLEQNSPLCCCIVGALAFSVYSLRLFFNKVYVFVKKTFSIKSNILEMFY